MDCGEVAVDAQAVPVASYAAAKDSCVAVLGSSVVEMVDTVAPGRSLRQMGFEPAVRWGSSEARAPFYALSQGCTVVGTECSSDFDAPVEDFVASRLSCKETEGTSWKDCREIEGVTPKGCRVEAHVAVADDVSSPWEHRRDCDA